MKTRLLTLLLAVCADVVCAQVVGIEQCFEMAKANYPLINQKNLAEQAAKYDIENISKTLMPQVALNAQATYQSDVTSIPIQISIPGIDGIPKMSKDQYKATLDVSQLLWDGGSAKALKTIAEAAANVEIQSIEVEMYPLREQVTNLYLGILMIEEQLQQLNLLDDNLATSLKNAEAMQKNGMAISSDVDLLKLELLNTAQRKTEITSLREAYIEMLSALTGAKLELPMLQKPSAFVDKSFGEALNRPETLLFARQTALFDAQESLIKAKNQPKFSLFAQGGYGKPGLNMLANSFEFFGIAGVRMSWNFGNLYTKNNEKRILNIGKEKIKNREETLKFNIERQVIQVRKEMESFAELLKNDDEIIRLRENVRKAAEKKYSNGVYTVNDLIKDINAENLARRNRSLHEMQYLIGVYKYKNLKNI